MKLASRKNGTRDGELVLVNADLTHFVSASHICKSLREAMESWSSVEPQLSDLSQQLENYKSNELKPFELQDFHSALPRTFQFVDGSAFLQHVLLVRKARGAEPSETLKTVPLMYQAVSDIFLDPTADVPQIDFSHGTDFEAEVGVITDEVPMGVTPDQALRHIKLVVLINDVSLRGLIPEELAQGFGFLQSKPNSALSAVAVTLDDLGNNWREGRLHLPLHVDYNGKSFGRANAGEMHFHFGDLISHAARTRPLMAGTLVGSGTVANTDVSRGSSCLAEKRMIEKIQSNEMKTPFMKIGDSIRIEMFDPKTQKSIFGPIDQRIVAAKK